MKCTPYGYREAAIFSVPIFLVMIYGLYASNWLLLIAASPFLWFVINFFRDPDRVIPQDKGALVSPADGQVTAIEEAQMPWIGKAIRVSVFMNVFSVHVNRMPVSGTVEYLEHVPGKFLNAMAGEAAQANERQLIGLQGDDGQKYLIVQIAGLIARNIVTDIRVGDHFSRGQRFGMIKFGSRTDIYIQNQSTWRAQATVGQWVKGGQDILGFVDQNVS